MIGRSGAGMRPERLQGSIRITLGVVLSLGWASPLAARPTLDQLVTVARARATVRVSPENVHENRLVSRDAKTVKSVEKVDEVHRRFLREDEVIRFILSDPDGDQVSSLKDASPLNPRAKAWGHLIDKDKDGRRAWQDIDDENPGRWRTGNPDIDDRPATDPLEQAILQFGGPEEMIEALLSDNASLGLYDPDNLIDAIETAGFPQASCQSWRSKFGKRGKTDATPSDEPATPAKPQKGGKK